MPASILFLSQLSSIAKHNNTRFGVVLRGIPSWQNETLQGFVDENKQRTFFQLGGQSLFSPKIQQPLTNANLSLCSTNPSFGNANSKAVPFKQGKQLLGQECQVLICDLSGGFDANSFSAAIGTLVGGGLLVIMTCVEELASEELADQALDKRWLEQGLQKLINIHQEGNLPPLPAQESSQQEVGYREQEQAIDKVIHVVDGHRKRPLVLTADRGRGKTSALGLASAALIKKRSLTILVTAPTLANVAPLFKHASKSLLLTHIPNSSELIYTDEQRVSTLRFIAPDELIKNKLECDLLIVDEAAAIPVPMLKVMVDNYHRLVFSSTIHGYEGSGRGFSLKFIPWLKQQRPNSVHTHLNQPIRWQNGDPLERWHNQTFLLDADFADRDSIANLDAEQLTLVKLNKEQLIAKPKKLNSCFALLVNAHYQTSPNDLFHLLSDELTAIYATMWQGVCVGCMLTVEEGGLSDDIISLVQQGKRRPSGQLVSVTLANHLGIDQAAKDKSIRVMRIAVHPDFQGANIGSSMLSQLQADNPDHYLSTSFGATAELIKFWSRNKFHAVKLGSQRDKASGCYSAIMVKNSNADWLERAEQIFSESLEYRITDSLINIELEVLRTILEVVKRPQEELLQHEMSQLQNYALGGTSFDSVAHLLRRVILLSLPRFSDRQLEDNSPLSSSPAVSELLIAKVLQQKNWVECSRLISATGRKQCEAQLRLDSENLIANLHCKMSELSK